MTPPRIDDWLRERGINPDVLRYVWQHGGAIRTPLGRVSVPRGFLTDGATGVIDLCEHAWVTHDRLYVIPETEQAIGTHIHRRRLNRYQCDLVYGWLLCRAGKYRAALRRPFGLMLINSAPWGPWKTYRRREAVMGRERWECHIAQTRIVPGAYLWRFPTNRIADAVYDPLLPFAGR